MSLKSKYYCYCLLTLFLGCAAGASIFLRQYTQIESARIVRQVQLVETCIERLIEAPHNTASRFLRAEDLFEDERLASILLIAPDNAEILNLNRDAQRSEDHHRAFEGPEGRQWQLSISSRLDRLDQSRRSIISFFILLFALLVSALAIPWNWLSGSLNGVLSQILGTIKSVDEGDLHSRVTLPKDQHLDEFGNQFNYMLQGIENTSNKIQDFASELSDKNIHLSQEIDERKNAENTAIENERKFHAIFDQSVQIIGILKADGTISEFNRTMLDFLGVEAGPLIGKNLGELDCWDEANEGRQWIGQAVQQATQGEFVRKEVTINGKDGQQMVMDFSLKPVLDAQGTVLSIIPEGRDISDRIAAERALQESEAQARQSQKMEAVGRLAGGIAHDFNNLLTSILGFGNMIHDDLPLESNNRRDIKEVIMAAERARELTAKLLTLSRKQITRVTPINLAILLAGMENLLKITLHEDVEYVPQLTDDLNYIMADAVSMEQIIVNLAVNARDAMPRSGRLYAKTENVVLDEEQCKKYEHAEPGAYVMLSMRDTGCGMSPEIIERAFEPFYTTKEVGHGTGLGLSTVYGIIQQFKGIITIDSEPGVGSNFKIYFPKVDYVPSDIIEEDRNSSGPPRGTETILLVEDEDAVRKMAIKLIQSLGYTILDAVDGEDAIRVWNEHDGKIDLIVSDVIMPNMSGPEMMDKLRITEGPIRHIYVSGFTRDKLAMAGADYSDKLLIPKPYSRDVLAQKIRDVLDTEEHEYSNTSF